MTERNHRFRAATNSDLTVLTELRREFNEFEPFPHPLDDQTQAETLRELIRDERAGGVWLIEAENQAVGYLAMTFGFSLEYGGRDALIDELYLREEWRRHGLGKAAIKFVEDLCRAKNIRALHLEVECGNTAAQSLYRKSGFETATPERSFLTKWIS